MTGSVPISRRALLMRLKLALGKRSLVLHATRPGSAQRAALGPYYLLGKGKAARAVPDLEAFARAEGALADHEKLAE